ncbi:hypothetical protein [Rhizobium sp. R693]|uniref:hypothetical protein n=1 Tax=Rhizobium sp. R693 TaxID=1764276 RepID=UPI001671F102|nr:hypothetical protein [Rhizobium sp. R693]
MSISSRLNDIPAWAICLLIMLFSNWVPLARIAAATTVSQSRDKDADSIMLPLP